ncbi:MAG: UDP-N-acetylglucosamine--N-acetylmuramyl-(pentapeptide) pyrophosphoryl-undecaprenol N-acetylglucosamine transferase [Patescibacteria group bacterium]
MKIFLVGGGTMGSVNPLLAVCQEIKERENKKQSSAKTEFFWLGTKNGPEKEILVAQGYHYYPIQSGKLRRYFSLNNFVDPFRIFIGFLQSLFLLKKYRPDLILSAGSFVAFPVAMASKISGTKMILHQMDLRPGLTNRLCAPLATKITVAFAETQKYFSKKKSLLLATPVRRLKFADNLDLAKKQLGLFSSWPTVLVIGGSLGAEKINELIFQNAPDLLEFCQILHVVGKGNQVVWKNKKDFPEKAERYFAWDYLSDNLGFAYQASDLLICRAGLATISEIIALRLPAMVIPIPNNQQEENAHFLAKKGLAVVFDQTKIKNEEFVQAVKKMLFQRNISDNIKENLKKIAAIDPTGEYVDFLQKIIFEKIK